MCLVLLRRLHPKAQLTQEPLSHHQNRGSTGSASAFEPGIKPFARVSMAFYGVLVGAGGSITAMATSLLLGALGGSVAQLERGFLHLQQIAYS